MIKLDIEPVPAEQAPMNLLLIADPSVQQIKSYLKHGHCFQARLDGEVVGAFVLKPMTDQVMELMNIAVAEERQGQGIGALLLQQVIATAKGMGATELQLGTGSFGYQLSFYQKAGFRVTGVDRDFFLKHYPEPIWEHGIQHKGMLRLSMELGSG